jgi:hypothetical protein
VVGRIPEVPSDNDPAWLLKYLATATKWQARSPNTYKKAYAICCDEWKRSGRECVQYIGVPANQLLISPPSVDGSATPRRRLSYRVHMIKCHGAQLDPNFYGQKGNRYPVALFSGTLRPRMKANTLAAAMCCYGAQVYDPNDPAANQPAEWPLAISYLREGACGFAGATMIAWVGPTQMMCADWIVAGYLKGVLDGASLGRALLDSKQHYVRWITQQGQVPDIADEKTLIEYVLLGDPSIHPVSSGPSPPVERLGAREAAAARRPTLLTQERRRRRVVSQAMSAQMREMLPARAESRRVSTARSAKVFEVVRDLMQGDEAAFGMKAPAARVHKVSAPLPAPPATARRRLELAGAPAVKERESFEYYWSGRRERNGYREIRLVKVETDAEGNVLRSRVVHSG